MFIDTHSHLYLGELQNHIPEAIKNLREANFSHTIQIGTSVESSHTCIELAHTYDIVRATVGIHPCEAQDIPIEKIPEQIAELEKMIQNEEKYIAGFWEIGFDYYHLSKNPEEAENQKWRQFEWFHAQAALAKKYNLGVVIHTRNCSEVTLRELEKSGLEKFVIHCFSEDWDFAEKVFTLSEESKISFTGILTYPKSIWIQEVAKKTPLHRIMIETDAPFLIPEAFRWKTDYCEPMHSLEVFKSLCNLRTETPEKIEQQLWENSTQFFKV
jgi:TatD DNase family protein